MASSGNSHTLSWGGFDIPEGMLDPHFIIIGATGSGKTLLLRCLMNSVLQRAGDRAPRIMVYDRKTELYPILVGMGLPPERIFVMNPLDARTSAWDIAADATTRSQAREIANILVHAEPDARDNPYFTAAAQNVLLSVMLTFNQTAPGRWILNDLLEATSSPADLKTVLASSVEGRKSLATHLTGADVTASNIMSTIQTKLGIYDTIAALWARTQRRTSIKAWCEHGGVLVLGADSTAKSALGAVNRALFTLAEMRLTGNSSDGASGETWVFFDEVRQAGKLDSLVSLLDVGRSKGVRVALGFQDIDGMRQVYGQYDASALIGQGSNVAVLRLNSPATALWAAEFFGKFEHWQTSYGESTTPQGKSKSENEQLRETFPILPQEFRTFAPTTPANGCQGAFTTPHIGAWPKTIPWAYIAARMGNESTDPEHVGFKPRDVREQDACPWITPTDFERLGLRKPEQNRDDDQPLAAME